MLSGSPFQPVQPSRHSHRPYSKGMRLIEGLRVILSVIRRECSASLSGGMEAKKNRAGSMDAPSKWPTRL
jgi:hypothetical protein